MARTKIEKVMDRLLTLYLVNECHARHHVQDLSETKLQKLVFLSEKELIERGCKAFNYRFIRLLHPTHSQELRNDLTDLVKLGYLEEPGYNKISKTDMILEDFGCIFRRNEYIIRIIDKILSSYANIPTERLNDMVRDMPWRRGRKIKDIQLRAPMTFPLRYKGAHSIFEIAEDELENVLIRLNLN